MSNDSKNKSNSTSNDNATSGSNNNNNNNDEARNSRRLYISDIHPGNADTSSDYNIRGKFSSYGYNNQKSHTKEVQKSSYKKVWREPNAEELIALDTNTQQKREKIRALILLPLTLNKNKGGDLYDNLNAEVSPDREKMIQMVTGMSSAEYFKSLPERVPNLFKKTPDRYTRPEELPEFKNRKKKIKEDVAENAELRPIQPKMRVGPPGDQYEQEADAVAEKVVSMDAPTLRAPDANADETAQRTAENTSDEKSVGAGFKPAPDATAQAPAQRTPIADSITPLQKSSDPVGTGRDLSLQGEIKEDVVDKAELRPLQRKTGAPGDDDDAQAKCAECEKEEALDAPSTKTAQRAVDATAPAPDTQASAATGGEVTPQTEASIRSAKGGGKSMSESERSYFEPRFGADFSGVKIHAGGQANDLAKSINARAFTVGSDIFFGSGEYNSDSTGGKKLMAHELTHTVQQGAVRRTPNQIQRVGEEFGQSSTEQTRHLISDLSSPITVGSEPVYELIQQGEELWNPDTEVTYRWTITDLSSGNIVFQVITERSLNRVRAAQVGNYKINVTALGNGKPVGISISLNHEVVAEKSLLTQSLTGESDQTSQTYRELVNDFRSYIIEAANSTGPDGISPLFLASVLFIEIFNRPKEGREEEIESVGSNFNDLMVDGWLYPWEMVDRSIGVGQIRSSTATMVTGDTPWIDQSRDSRGDARERTEDNFDELNIETKKTIFNMLRWPKSNILMAAKLLSTLKNRSNRFPELTKEQYVENRHAVGVVASEYNLGPSDSNAQEARASWYGEDVWNSMQNDTILRHYFSGG